MRATRVTEAKKRGSSSFTGENHSEPNVAAILLGRVDLRVDRKQFRNHMKIQDSLCAVSHVSHIGTGRHEVVPPKSQKQIHRPSMPFPLIDDEPKKGARTADAFESFKRIGS